MMWDMGYIYIYIHSKIKAPKIGWFQIPQTTNFIRPCGSAWLLRCEVSFQMSPDYTGSPFYPQEKNFVGGIYIYICICGFIYVHMGFINIYMCLYGIYMGWSCLYDMGFSIVMGDPLYRWIMGWMGWMQCLAQSGAQGKRAKSARKADKKEWSNYIYTH